MTTKLMSGLCLVVVLASGCETYRLHPGAEYVAVTHNPADVAGCRFIASNAGCIGALYDQPRLARVFAQNFTHSVGGNIALLGIQMGGGDMGTMTATVDAYWREGP